MSEKSSNPTIPPRRHGLVHVVDAAGYSSAGLRRLFAEAAARLEIIGAIIGAAVLVWQGASLTHGMIYAGLCLAVLVVEALNTAIEVLTDRISPEWSQTAKDAKDLGSIAVGLSLCGPAGFLLWHSFLAP